VLVTRSVAWLARARLHRVRLGSLVSAIEHIGAVSAGLAFILAAVGVTVGVIGGLGLGLTVALTMLLVGVGLIVGHAIVTRNRAQSTTPRTDHAPTASPEIAAIVGKTFENRTVVLDGARFFGCTFRNCTMQWFGGAWGGWDNKCVFDRISYETLNPIAVQAVDQLKGLGLLGDAEFAKSWGPREVRVVAVTAPKKDG